MSPTLRILIIVSIAACIVDAAAIALVTSTAGALLSLRD